MIIAALTISVIWCMFYTRIQSPMLLALCAVLGIGLALLTRHNHTQFLTIDVFAQTSRLNKVSPMLKFWTVLALMVLCVSSQRPAAGIFTAAAAFLLAAYAGGLKPHNYIHLLVLPCSFLLLSGLALLFELSAEPLGVINIRIFRFWLCVTSATQARAMLVTVRAFGAVSCLYLLSLTTPLSDLIGVLRRIKCPNVMIDLMYLIYRYIFILLSMYYTMRDAAKSRLGYSDYRTGMRTAGNLFSNLLARSYRQANTNFDAMESRCFNSEIRFLENRTKITAAHLSAAVALVILTVVLR